MASILNKINFHKMLMELLKKLLNILFNLCSIFIKYKKQSILVTWGVYIYFLFQVQICTYIIINIS